MEDPQRAFDATVAFEVIATTLQLPRKLSVQCNFGVLKQGPTPLEPACVEPAIMMPHFFDVNHDFFKRKSKAVRPYCFVQKHSVLDIPVFENFGVVNESPRILLMIDEAHRTQGSSAAGSLSDNLFGAFPQATRLAFTGTPLIRVKGKEKTVDRFGDYIDKYKLQDAVADGTTVQILYEGKTAETAIDEKVNFDAKVDSQSKRRPPTCRWQTR